MKFIGYKQTNKQTDRQAKFIYRLHTKSKAWHLMRVMGNIMKRHFIEKLFYIPGNTKFWGKRQILIKVSDSKMKYITIVLGILIVNLGSVLADCTKEQEQNSWNVVQWILRNIKNQIKWLNIQHFCKLKICFSYQ